MLGKLAQNGYRITLDETKADIVIINTCSFIQDAEKESVKSIFDMINAGKKIIITGCLPQKHKKELQELIPEALAFVGTTDIDKIVDVVKKVTKDKKAVYAVNEKPEYNYPEEVERQQITMGASSYVKIAEGCDFACGYCIIPQLRGKYKSRKIENIVEEVKNLVKKGVTEICLIAQDTTSYGKDLYGKPQLKELLIELNKIEDLSWIRILYTYPSLLSDDLLKTINEFKIPTYEVYMGQNIIQDKNITFQVLYTLKNNNPEDANFCSVVTKLTYNQKSFLFMGDGGSKEGDVEEALLKMNVDIKSDVLKVGHHGSTYASSKEFINKVYPEYAFISCAKVTSTGHPHKKALDRISSCCKKILQSRNDGTILFITDGININYQTHIGE
jgi:hypothetical protein